MISVAPSSHQLPAGWPSGLPLFAVQSPQFLSSVKSDILSGDSQFFVNKTLNTNHRNLTFCFFNKHRDEKKAQKTHLGAWGIFGDRGLMSLAILMAPSQCRVLILWRICNFQNFMVPKHNYCQRRAHLCFSSYYDPYEELLVTMLPFQSPPNPETIRNLHIRMQRPKRKRAPWGKITKEKTQHQRMDGIRWHFQQELPSHHGNEMEFSYLLVLKSSTW